MQTGEWIAASTDNSRKEVNVIASNEGKSGTEAAQVTSL